MDNLGERNMRIMGWNCHLGGRGENCFNLKRRPKFGVFDDCFPRRINFTDVDGILEIGGHFCMMEWKGDGGSVGYGQDLLYKRFTTQSENVVIVVHGNAETMEVKSFGFYKSGIYREARTSSLEDLKGWLRGWCQWADHPVSDDEKPTDWTSEWDKMWARPFDYPERL
jgi:hypothetical protein